jgi:alpha-glucosidase
MSTPWWHDAVVYQVYPRSFQDSDGDGVGDLAGVVERLDHLCDLGVDAFWLSPFYPSPMADFGYDVSDFTGVDPTFGTLEDFDRLLAAAHARGLKVLLDLVPCHTSVEHPWFRAHPDRYVWSDGGPPNNWRATFGGPAWTRDEPTGRWYLHSHYPEQPDLDWRNPEVVTAMQDVVRFWIERGVDGLRLDAVTRLGKDPEWRDDPVATTVPPFPWNAGYAELEHRHSKNVHPWVGEALAAVREAAGDALLVGEVVLRPHEWAPYLEHLDSAFAFELFHAPLPWTAEHVRGVVDDALAHGRPGWVLSNHDAPRLATRLGRENERAALMLVLTLPGLSFLYAGDEIGMEDGPGGDPPLDRAGRDPSRHPMQWDAGPHGGFTAGTPWLPAVDPARRNVADQRRDPDSTLSLVRSLVALRRRLGAGLRWVDAAPGVLAYERGDHVVALNLGEAEATLPAHGEAVLLSERGAVRARRRLAPRAGAVVRR